MRSIPTGLGERKQLHASPRIGTSPRAFSTPTGMRSASGPPPPPPCARAWRTNREAPRLLPATSSHPPPDVKLPPPSTATLPRHPTRRRRCPSSRGRPSPPPGLRRRRGARADAGGGDERAAGAARAVRRTGGYVVDVAQQHAAARVGRVEGPLACCFERLFSDGQSGESSIKFKSVPSITELALLESLGQFLFVKPMRVSTVS